MFLYPAVNRRFAHIHTNCALPQAHKQTPIHIGTSAHNCTNAPPHGMHLYLRALTFARTHTCTYSHPHKLTFLNFHTRMLSHSRTLTLTSTHQARSHTLSHTPSNTDTVALTYTCALATLQAHSRAHSYTHIHMHTLIFVHTHNIARSRARMHAQFCGLPHSGIFTFSGAFLFFLFMVRLF